MEKRSERPIALALALSLLAHVLAMAAYHRWYAPDATAPIAVAGASSIAIALHVADGDTPVAPEPEAEKSAAPSLPAPQPAEPVIQAPEPAMPWPLEEVAVEPVNLNPVPILREEYSIGLATLAVQAPMAEVERTTLEAAVNHIAAELPEWTDPAEPLYWQDGERDFEIRIEHHEPATATSLERAILEITTEVDGLSLSARVPVKRMAFSHFAQVVDRWDPTITLSGDRIVGRFHSNSELWVDAGRGSKPLVTGPASVAGRVNMVGAGKREQVFADGLETRAPRLDLPREPFPWREVAGGGERTHVIHRDARVVFMGEGGYRWYSLEDPGHSGQVQPDSFPWLIVADEGVVLQVEGEVSGSVLVYSPKRIQVTGSLTYARDPREEAGSPDFLGLVSDANVEIAPPSVTGPGSINLFASVYAGRQFRVRNYRASNGGKLEIVGSVTAGSLSATEPRFTTHLEFDRRLEDTRPAWFPLTGRYLLDGPAPDWTIQMVTAAH